MFLQGPGQASLLWTVLLLQDVLGFCERPAWTRIAWDMTPEDLEQLTKEQSNCLHDSICQICHSFTGLTLSEGCLEILYASCKVAVFLIAGLSLHYLLPKLKHKHTKPAQVTIQTTDVLVTTETHEEYTHNTDKMLYRLVTNTSKMMKYMKHMAHRHQKEAKYRKLNKKRKADEIEDEDDEQFFPVCPHNHSSSGDTIMHEI